MFWRITSSILMPALATSVWAIELNPECHKLYEMFNLPNLSYEDVGKIADKMHENTCWPVLQGVTIQVASAEPEPPVITSCSELASLITKASEDVVRMYGITQLTRADCRKSFFRDEEGRLNWLGRRQPDEYFYRACGPLVGATTEQVYPTTPDAPVQVLSCLGTVRFTDGDGWRYFYLERFPDGEEYWGFRAF